MTFEITDFSEKKTEYGMAQNQCLISVKNMGFNTHCNKEISQSF